MQVSNQKYWKMFLKLCLKTENTSRLEDLFHLFFTMEEKEHLASRMEIIQDLLDGKLSQREISEKKHVSICQITRGSNALKIISDDLLKFIQIYLRKHK
jgi:TrpR family trp operon transcriptional repressor